MAVGQPSGFWARPGEDCRAESELALAPAQILVPFRAELPECMGGRPFLCDGDESRPPPLLPTKGCPMRYSNKDRKPKL